MAESGPASKCSVLIVEDDRASRYALRRLLARRGHKVCCAARVSSAIAKLDGQACAVIDLDLPDGRGTEVIQRIHDDRRPIRCAVVTGSIDDNLIEDAGRLGAELVLRKPVDVDALLAWIERCPYPRPQAQ